jgi:hypothetical protein
MCAIAQLTSPPDQIMLLEIPPRKFLPHSGGHLLAILRELKIGGRVARISRK